MCVRVLITFEFDKKNVRPCIILSSIQTESSLCDTY